MSRRGSISGHSKTFLLDIANMFHHHNYDDSLPNHDRSVYSIPKLSRQIITKLSDMIDHQTALLSCCQFVGPYFRFDPAYVSACGYRQFSEEECHVGLLANFLAWAGNEGCCTADFLGILSHSIISTFQTKIDAKLLYCLYASIYIHSMYGIGDLDAVVITEICDFFVEHSELFEVGIQILFSLLNIAFRSGAVTSANYVERTLNKVIILERRLLAEFDFTDVFVLCAHKLEKLDFDTISLLATISDIKYDKHVLEVFTGLSLSAANHLKEGHTVTRSIGQKNEICSAKLSVPYDFEVNTDTFVCMPKEMTPLSEELFDSHLTASDLLSEKQFSIVSLFQPLLRRRVVDVTYEFLIAFSNIVRENYETEYFIELYIFLISMLRNLGDFTMPEEVIQAILDSPVFSSDYLLMSTEGDFQVMNFLRNETFSIFMENWPSLIESVLKRAEDDLFLLIEHIGRIVKVISFDSLSVFMSDEIIRIISAVVNLFLYMMNSESDSLMVTGYCTMITLVVSVAESPDAADLAFSSSLFTNMFLGHVFHSELRKTVMNILSKYLTQTTCSTALANIASFCIDFFQISRRPDPAVASDLLNCLVDSMIHHHDIVGFMARSVSPILSFFLYYPAKECMQSIVSLLLLISSSDIEFQLTHRQMMELGQKMARIELDERGQSTQAMVLSLIAGNKSVTANSLFIIRNPSFIILLLHVMSENIPEVLCFFDRLCEYSIYNVIQCHEGELDLFFIELLQTYPNDFCFRGKEFSCQSVKDQHIDDILKFLSKIMSYRASPVVVEKLLSLIVPSVDGQFSPMADRVLNSMVDLFNKIPMFPTIRYVFTPEAKAVKTQISLSSCNFSIACHMMVDGPLATISRAKPEIMKIVDKNGVTIELFLSGRSIHCEITANGNSSGAPLCNNVPSCQWFLVVVVFKSRVGQANQLHINFSVNKEQSNLFTVADPGLDPSSLTVMTGGYVNDAKSNIPHVVLGKPRIFDQSLTTKMIETLFVNDPNSEPEGFVDKLKGMTYETENGFFQNMNQVISNFSLDYTLLPFFKFSETAPPHFIEKLVDMLQLSKNRDVFGIVAAHLMNSDALTYALYLRFFSLFSINGSDELFSRILFNFELWCSAKTVRRVVTHWSSVLFPTFPQHFLRTSSFGDILSSIRVFFYYSDTDNVDFAEKRRFNVSELPVCHSHLNRLLYQVAEIRLSDNDVNLLLSHIFSCNDLELKCNFLSLLSDISCFIKDKEYVAQRLHPLFLTSHAKVYGWALRCILLLSEKDHINSVICHTSILRTTEDVFSEINALIDCGFAEVFPLAAMVSNKHGNYELLLQKFTVFDWTPDMRKRLFKVKYWFIHLFIAAIKTEQRKMRDGFLDTFCKIMFAADKFNIYEFYKVFVFMDLLDIYFSVKTTFLKRGLITQLTSYAMRYNEHARDVMRCCGRFVCFSFGDRIHSDALLDSFSRSPFADSASLPVHAVENLQFPMVFDENIRCDNLIFRLNIDGSGDLNFDMMLRNVLDVELVLHSPDSTLDTYFAFLHCIVDKHVLMPHELHKKMGSVTSAIRQHSQSVDTGKLMTTVRKLKSYLSAENQKFSELLSIPGDVFQQSNDSMHKNKIFRTLATISEKNQEAEFRIQHMNKFTIWRAFAEELLFKKMITMNESFQSMKLHPYTKKTESQLKPKTVRMSAAYHEYKAVMIQIESRIKCKFVVTTNEIIIASSIHIFRIKLGDIRWLLQKPNNCIEITKTTDELLLFEFSEEHFISVMNDLKDTTLPQTAKIFQRNSDYATLVKQSGITNDWVNMRMSNWEYLIALNIIGGQSYLDKDRYPIMPLIRDFESPDEQCRIDACRWLRMFDCFRAHLSWYADEKYADLIKNRKHELTPEFYSIPECFVGLESEPLDHVYELRELLESQLVTVNLRHWIDRTFGILQPECSSIPRLFNEPHPDRKSRPRLAPKNPIVIQLDYKDAIYMAWQYKNDNIIIRVVTQSGTFREFAVNFDRLLFSMTSSIEIPIAHSVIGSISQDIVIMNSLDLQSRVVRNGEVSAPRRLDPVKIDFSGQDGCFGSFEGSVFCVDSSTGRVFGMCHVADGKVTCVASSVTHGVTVVGTADGNILYFERNSGNFINGCSLGGKVPKKVVITVSWGFVVVETQESIIVMTLNGTKVREIETDYEWRCWTTWASLEGVDYIAICDTFGRVHLADVFRVHQIREICAFKMPMIGMIWSHIDAGLILVFRNGKITFFPCMFEN